MIALTIFLAALVVILGYRLRRMNKRYSKSFEIFLDTELKYSAMLNQNNRLKLSVIDYKEENARLKRDIEALQREIVPLRDIAKGYM